MSKSFHENCRTRWTLSGGKELRKSLQSTAVYIDWMNRNLYEIGMKKRKKEKKRKENAFVVNITTVMAATWEFTHHTRRDRTWPLSTCEGFFFDLFFLLVLCTRHSNNYYDYYYNNYNYFSTHPRTPTSRWWGEDRERRNIVTISVLDVRMQTFARAHTQALSLLYTS